MRPKGNEEKHGVGAKYDTGPANWFLYRLKIRFITNPNLYKWAGKRLTGEENPCVVLSSLQVFKDNDELILQTQPPVFPNALRFLWL